MPEKTSCKGKEERTLIVLSNKLNTKFSLKKISKTTLTISPRSEKMIKMETMKKIGRSIVKVTEKLTKT